MAPIANPEDMTPSERDRVYGAHYAWHRDQDKPSAPRVHHARAHATTIAAAPKPIDHSAAATVAATDATTVATPVKAAPATVAVTPPAPAPTPIANPASASGPSLIRQWEKFLAGLTSGAKSVDVPGLGARSSGSVLAAILTFLAIILLVAIGRMVANRREAEERRRRFHTMAADATPTHFAYEPTAPMVMTPVSAAPALAEIPPAEVTPVEAPVATVEPIPVEAAPVEPSIDTTPAHTVEAEASPTPEPIVSAPATEPAESPSPATAHDHAREEEMATI